VTSGATGVSGVPADAYPAPRRSLVVLRDFLAALRRAAPAHLHLYTVVVMMAATAPVLVAWLTKLVVDRLVAALAGEGPDAPLLPLAIGLAAAGVAMAVLPQATSYLGREMGRRVELDTTDRLFVAVTRLPGLRRFEDPRFLDQLRLAQEGSLTAGTTVTDVFGSGRSLVTVGGFVGALLAVSPVMTVLVLAAAVPSLVAHLRLSRWRVAMRRQLTPVERWQVLYRDLLTGPSAAKESRLFGSGAFLRDRMMRHLRHATTARRHMDRRELLVEGSLALLGALGSGLGLVWAVDRALSGALSPGDVTLFIGAVASLQSALTSLVISIAGAHHGLLLFDQHLSIFRAAPDLVVAEHPEPLPPLRRAIELRDVWFRYDADHPWVLRGLNLRIPAGRSMGVVGLNGAGKSTLIKLLCRFYDPDHGQILWDGVDLRDVCPEELRARISGVFQDHMCYDLSAADNIVLGDTTAPAELERVREAASLVGMDDTLNGMPNGYQTLLTRMFLGEQEAGTAATGVMLSGGQWQRVALARAFFRGGRDLVVLDEPSSGLDPAAEAELQARTRHHGTGRTSILISHRLNTIRDADLLVVLEEGAVAEQGTHDSLMAANGAYARLFRLQADGYRAEPRGNHARDRVSSA
jgi:ATP-binding cassette subfamily B protein